MNDHPKWANKILSIFSGNEDDFDLLITLQKLYQDKYEDDGKLRAYIWYWKQVIYSIPRLFINTIYRNIYMFKNYFKIAVRNIQRHKVFSSINIMGLALGLACCIFIMLWIFDELAYDRFHENSNSIYRVEEEIHYSGKIFKSMATSPAVAPALKEEFPEIADASRYDPVKNILVRYEDKMFYEPDIVTAEPSFFNIFSFEFIKGDKNSVLNDPHSVVITQDIAEKYFGDEDPIGKMLIFENTDQYMVNGVIETVPQNTHLRFNIIIPFSYITGRSGFDENNWRSSYISTYVKLNASTDKGYVNDKISQLHKEHVEDSDIEYYLQPVIDIHLYSNYGSGNIRYVYIFSATAALVLLIACINFMNLSTARSAKRAKEIGMRKVVGAQRKHIIKQFFGESLIMTFAALVFALGIVMILLPQFNQLAGKQLSLMTASNIGNLILGLFIIMFVTGIMAGSYPALLLSSFRPIQTIRGSLSLGSGGTVFRKIMVLFQFSISIFLIIATITVKSQLSHMQNMNLGWEKEHLIYLNINDKILPQYDVLKNELVGDSRILGVTLSRQLPGRFGNTLGNLRWEGKDPDYSISAHFNSIDYDFPETLGIGLTSGRTYSKNFPSDTVNAVLINSEFERAMGGRPAAGKPLWIGEQQFDIIGVMEDFHIQSARNKIEPTLLFLDPRGTRYIFIRIKPEDISSTLTFLSDTWKTYLPDYPMEYNFMDETFNNIYRAESRMGVLFTYFTSLAILIACLGLFGLSAFMAQQRTKEMGIRKVYGASVPGIVVLLIREFLKWVVAANIIAWPLSWYLMNTWLQSFAYRIDIYWTVFILSGLSALMIAVLTVVFQALKAARTNPINSLRYE